jgi:hypothetical protein
MRQEIGDMYGISEAKPRSIGKGWGAPPLLKDAEKIKRGIERCRSHIRKMSSQGRYCEGALLVLTRLERRLDELNPPRTPVVEPEHVAAADRGRFACMGSGR